MGYRLYVNKKGAGIYDWCGGKVYGYEGVDYKGAVYLYQNVEDFKDWVDEYHWDIEDIGERVRFFFECIPCVEIEITGEQFLTFLKLYREDAKYDFKYFEPIDLRATYRLEWW